MDIYSDTIDDTMAKNTKNNINIEMKNNIDIEMKNNIDIEMKNNIDIEMLKAQEEAANAFQSIISQIENQISPEQKELLNELSIEDQEIFLMTLMSLENDEIEGDIGIGMDVDVEDVVDHEDHIHIESARIDSGHVEDMASGITSNSSVNSTIGGTGANHLTFIPPNTVTTTTSTNQNTNTVNNSTSIHTDACNNHIQNDNVKSILEKLSFLQNSLSNLHENNHLNLLNDNNNEFLSALTLQVESLQKSQLQLENNSISTPSTAPSNIDTNQGNKSLNNTFDNIQHISQSNTQNHIHQKNHQHSSISIPSHTQTKMNVKSSGLDSIENINILEIDQMKNSPISSNDMINSMAALDSMELIPGSKEQALFALYVAHYQREALKMMQNSTQNNLETPNPSLAALSNTNHIDSSNNATSHLLKSTFQIPSQVSLSQKAIPQNIDQIASLNHQQNNNTPISTVASGSEMMDPILALSLQPLQALPATAQPFIDINDMETMNAVMQQALQAALQQNMVDENQVNANTMALNEALTAASHQSTNGVQGATTIDLNGIDLTGVDLDNFDFSNIDLSNVDFSQMDFSGIDFSMPSFDPANIDAKGMETVTRFDVDGKPFVNLDPISNGSTNPTTATTTTQKATGVKKEKKERKPAAPKEPKPPRVKAPQGPQICPTCNKTFKSRKTLSLHERSHAAVKPYPCLEPGCSSSFAQKSHLNAHKLTHSGERPYKCTLCDASYTTPSRRNEHMRSHTRETKYSCEECDMKFRNITNYKNHMTTHLPKDQRPSKKWYCLQCDAVYAQRTSLIRHRNKIHPKSAEQIEQERILKEQKKLEKLAKKTKKPGNNNGTSTLLSLNLNDANFIKAIHQSQQMSSSSTVNGGVPLVITETHSQDDDEEDEEEEEEEGDAMNDMDPDEQTMISLADQQDQLNQDQILDIAVAFAQEA